ncbi:hypothetical protein NNO07_12270 [Pseudomonas resinovorans]|uniref:Uncharacterized protein n=1 Tax=Metapseudomonas resinovorans TaxID=53412 RepID=A0ABT4Y4Q9_METRE|nr:hypothetical protein [Pseudomonas resinovorans]MDA8483845.1 hypothetical protein [Pseudomonas resinovorans]
MTLFSSTTTVRGWTPMVDMKSDFHPTGSAVQHKKWLENWPMARVTAPISKRLVKLSVMAWFRLSRVTHEGLAANAARQHEGDFVRGMGTTVILGGFPLVPGFPERTLAWAACSWPGEMGDVHVA